MLQNNHIKNEEIKGITTENVSILSSMQSAFPVYFEEKSSLAKYAKSGYDISHFVERFIDTNAGAIPVVSRRLNFKDRFSTLGARLGITRNNYRVAPGLYALGEPDENSEVLVTANFKLTFDVLRTNIDKINVWILVLDTFGVNVWCAAGKGTFSTQELVKRVQLSGVEKIVKHRRVILPQLSATGIRATDVKKLCGFKVIYGPIRASDIPLFIKNGRKAEPDMRRVTFTFKERLILTPIELTVGFKSIFITVVTLAIISLINPEIFSSQNSLVHRLINTMERGYLSFIFLFIGFLSGAVLTPALLPFLPFKAFAAKGVVTGAIITCFAFLFSSASSLSFSAMIALLLFGTAVSSWFAMNFTGATPFTSPSGVEKEMKQFIPVQAGAMVLSLGLWIYSAF